MSVEASAPRSPQGLALSAAQAACLFAWCLVVRGPTRLPSAIEGDESLYLLIADRMRLGELPYTGVWDHKPAGLYLLFHWSLEVFGRHVASVRLLACCMKPS